MNLLHNSYLLYKVNQVYKEIKKRHSAKQEATEEGQEETASARLESVEEARSIGNSIFKQVIFFINRNAEQLDSHSIQQALNGIAQGAEFEGRGELSQQALETIEKKVMADFPKFMSMDLASIISSFLRLNYVPRQILNELNQISNLSTFNKYACLTLLESMVQVGYNESQELYEKLFEQLQKSSANMNTKLVSRAINIVLRYKEIFKKQPVHHLAQFYIDRFNDSVSKHEKQVETEIVLSSLESVKRLHSLQGKDFDHQLMIQNCLRLLEDRVDKLRPDILFKSIENFEDPKHKTSFVGSLLKSMRESRYDIRRFYFTQVA